MRTSFGSWTLNTKTYDPNIKERILKKSSGIYYQISNGHEDGHFIWVQREVPKKDIISIELKDAIEGEMAKDFYDTVPSFGLVYCGGHFKAHTDKIKDYGKSWRYLPIIRHIRHFLNPPYYYDR